MRGSPAARARSALVAGYAITSALSATTAGKVGSHVNHFIEFMAALAVAGGLVVARAWSADGCGRALRACAAGVVMAQAYALFAADHSDRDLARAQFADRASLERLELEVRMANGPVLADEAMGVVVRANRDVMFDPFDLTQQVRQGRWRDAPVIAMLRAQAIALVIIDDGERTPPAIVAERWTPALLEAIHAHYDPAAHLAGATVYRPRDAAR